MVICSSNRKLKINPLNSIFLIEYFILGSFGMQTHITAILFAYTLTGYTKAVEKCFGPNGNLGHCRPKAECHVEGAPQASCSSGKVCCIGSETVRKKCQEYSKYVYTQESAAVLLPRMQMHNISKCRIEAVPLVVGGEKAHAMEFPHMVAIGYGKKLETAEWMCGGSLISEKFVLTAAHCSKSRDKGPAIFARLGDLDLKRTDDESHVQDFIIVERIIHPNYAPPSRYHDIALFKLSGSVEMGDFSRPACLHSLPNELSIRKAIATGWGKLDYKDVQNSDHLMKVTLDIINYKDCNATFAAEVGGRIMHDGVIEQQLCAGDLGGGKDTCQGDSGGPLQIVLDNPYCMYDIVAVTSFGKFCGFKNSPAIYTKVSHYVNWIESVIWQ